MRAIHPLIALFAGIIISFIGKNSLLYFGDDEIGYTNFYMIMDAISGVLFFASVRMLVPYLRRYKKYTRMGADVGMCGCVVELLDEFIGHPTWFQIHELILIVVVAGIIGYRVAGPNE